MPESRKAREVEIQLYSGPRDGDIEIIKVELYDVTTGE